ncbi:MAG: hypothetical protein IAE91_04285, partial [Ignavibacteriaceae bacterium]|nr:hypothetical protein [Ignavibacteriaceae bacterium]
IYSRQEELLNKNFSDAKPIFLITNSDINNENSELAKRVKEDLKINEDDRVLRTGIPGPEGWKNEVIKSIKKYSKPGIEPISIQKTNVRKLVKDIGEVIIDIKMELRDFDIALDNKEYKQLDKIIKEFKSVSNSLKKELRIAIDKHFNPYFENIQVNVLNKLLETRKSIIDKFKTGIGDTFKSQTEIQNELVEKIKTSFHESNDITVDMNYILALNQVVNKEMLRHKIVMGLPQDDKNTNLDSKKLLVGETQKMQVDKLNDNKSDIKDTLSKDIKLLINSKIEGEFSDDLKFNIKLLPLIMLETERFINIVEGSYDGNLILNGNFADQKTLTDVYSENRKEVALAIAALFGLDIAEGGGIDLFGILPSVSAQTAVAFSVNWYVLGALSLISAIYLNSLFNKSFDAKVNFTKNEIKDIKNQFIENLMSNFDNKMDFIEDIIRDCLTRRLGLDFDFARLQNCHIALKDLEEVKKELEKLSRSEL